MAEQKTMLDVLFVNMFGPRSNAITGLTATEMVDHLHAEGLKVGFLSMKAHYRANRERGTSPKAYPIWEIRSWYGGDNRILRLVMSLVGGLRLFLKACRIKHRTVVVMTEPPLLFFWFQLFRSLTSHRLGYYTMDVYPDAFVAGNYTQRDNLLYRLIHQVVYRKPPDWLVALGKAQQQSLTAKFGSIPASLVFPCGLVPEVAEPAQRKTSADEVSFGYGGNIGEAHDANFLVQFIEALDPAKHTIFLSLYGTKSEAVLSAVRGHPAVVLCPVLTQEDIAAIDVNLVSLLPAWDHVCVPSKAVTAVSCGNALLLNVSTATDTWQMFSDAAWHIPPATDYRVAINEFLQNLTPKAIATRRAAAKHLAQRYWQEREQAFVAAADFLRQPGTPGS